MQGSVTNRIAERCSRTNVPEVGMGVTELLFSDRHANTITRVSASGKSFWMKRDIATRIDSNGMSDSQSYSYAPNPEAPEVKVYRTKDGRWKVSARLGAPYVMLGERREHYDYGF